MKVIDSSGWIEFFANGDLAEPFAAHLAKIEDVATPSIVLYEVYKKLKVSLSEEHALMAVSQMEKTQIVPLSESLAYQAADISIQYKLPMADSIVYATAQFLKASLVTCDADFKSLPGVTYISPTENSG